MRGTWIVIADASEARVFEVEDRDSDRWREIEHHEWPRSRRKPTELETDSHGSAHHFGGDKRRSAMEATPDDAQDFEHDKFARALIDRLAKAATQNAYERIVLVAPPEFLGRLRSALDNTAVENKLIGTINKDYTKLREHELPDRVGPKLPVWM